MRCSLPGQRQIQPRLRSHSNLHQLRVFLKGSPPLRISFTLRQILSGGASFLKTSPSHVLGSLWHATSPTRKTKFQGFTNVYRPMFFFERCLTFLYIFFCSGHPPFSPERSGIRVNPMRTTPNQRYSPQSRKKWGSRTSAGPPLPKWNSSSLALESQ